MHKTTKRQLMKYNVLSPSFKGCFFVCVKRFRPIIGVANNSQEKFSILNVPQVGFLCYLDSGEILL